jgi:orotidine-5'-phosphate decarboxylase
MDFVRQLLARNKRVFLDLKLYDIGETVKRATKVIVDAGVDFLTIHGNREILHSAAEARGDAPLKLLAVTVLTNMDAADIRDMGYQCSLEDLVVARATNALAAGCDGVISSPREARLIKEKTQNRMLVVTPGIRPLGAGLQDQKRVTDPKMAIENGSDYLVVGRPITAAPDPKRAAEEILAEMQAGFDAVQR